MEVIPRVDGYVACQMAIRLGTWIIVNMSTDSITAVLPRTAKAVREALAELAPEECSRFEAEFHRAIVETDDDFDTDRITKLIGRWWAMANPDPVADAILARIKAGDTSDIVVEWRAQPDGSQQVYRKTPDGEWVFSHVLDIDPA
jgi:hypothetical protein